MTESEPGRWLTVGTYQSNRPLNVRGRARGPTNLCSCDQTWSNGTKRDLVVESHGLNISLSAANGSSSSISHVLDSMSPSAVVSYPQVLQQLSTESSEEAKDSQVHAILSPGLKALDRF